MVKVKKNAQSDCVTLKCYKLSTPEDGLHTGYPLRRLTGVFKCG